MWIDRTSKKWKAEYSAAHLRGTLAKLEKMNAIDHDLYVIKHVTKVPCVKIEFGQVVETGYHPTKSVPEGYGYPEVKGEQEAVAAVYDEIFPED